jgi:transposase
MAAAFVEPYRQGGKNDSNDAAAICEAVARPKMRFVPLKSVEQQAILAVHRLRQGLVEERTALANRLRGLLCEYGVVIGVGLDRLRRSLPEILEDGNNEVPGIAREVFVPMPPGSSRDSTPASPTTIGGSPRSPAPVTPRSG